MSTFSDDFNRGDGGLGNNWNTVLATVTIASNHVNWSGQGAAYNTSVNASGRQEGILSVNLQASGDLGAGIYLKASGTTINGYTFSGTGTLASPTWSLRRWASSSATALRSVGGSGLSTGVHTLRLLYENGILSCWVDGAFIMNYADSTHGASTGAGIYSATANSAIDDVTILGDETVGLQISPSPIGNFGNSTDITLTGVTTSWTSGTPGTPTFTVDHGTLSNQSIASATSATATYTPGSFLGIATFADPLSGATCQVTVTSDTTVVFPPSGAGGLSEAVIGWLDAQANHGGLVVAEQDGAEDITEGIYAKGAFGEVLLGKRVQVGEGSPAAPDPALLFMLWRILNGQQTIGEASFPAPTFDTVDAGLTYLKESLDALRTLDFWTLAGVIAEIKGDTEGATDLNTSIGFPTFTGVYDSVMDQVNQLRGGNGTVSAVYDKLVDLMTIDDRTLTDVQGWVEAVRGSGLPTIKTVMDKLALIQTGNLPDLLTIDQHISTMSAIVTAIDLVLGAQSKLPGTMAYILDDVWEAIQAMQNAPDGGAGILWPGVENVTLGTEVALTDGLVITGPLNGVLLTITGYPVRTQKYEFGAINSWSRVGAVIFGTDRDDYERSQTFSLDRQILIPQTMESAASATFRVNEGWEGTARGWTRNA